MKPFPEDPALDQLDWLAEYGFDFDQPGDRWMERLREAEASSSLGRIGDYELEREISRGGQGIVFRARQPGAQRSIALKRMLAGSFATPGMRRRFEREVEAAALLDHPNIVSVYGMEVADGMPVYAMEWIDGVPINEWARGRGPEALLELFLRIADAVQHAHSRGVLHRDLKPSNILVDESGQPHVLDFGLAKCLQNDEASLSKSAEAFGTPAYAAPEQLDGNETRVDARADVYSLGVILFELLTKASPYGEWEGLPDLLRRVGRVRAPKPSAFDPRIGRDLDTIVLHALEPRREERYESVAALASDVRRYAGGASINAAPPSSWLQLRRLVAGNQLAAALIATVFLGTLGFGINRHLLLGEARMLKQVAEERAQRNAALLAFVPDCVHIYNRELSAYVAKPGTVLDESVSHSSPNPHFNSEAGHDQPDAEANR